MIEEFSFGKIKINGLTYTDDIKIIGGKVVPEWWRKKGHSVEIDDIKDILAAQPDILVIGKGQPGLMKSSGSLREYLKNSGIELIENKTSKAIEDFNRLLKAGKNVSAGFHLTC